MLLYDNHARLRLLLQFYGSIYSRVWKAAILFSSYSLGLLLLKTHLPQDLLFMPVMEHPFAAQCLGVLVAFTVTFRTTIAWLRYWEACRELMFMYSKWCDAYSQLMGFITSTEKTKENCDTRRLEHTRMEITHFFSLLSAVAAERLMRGDIRRMEMRRRKGVPWNQQVVTKGSLRTTDLTGSKNLFPMNVLVIDPTQAGDFEVDEGAGDGKGGILTAAPHEADTRAGLKWMSMATSQKRKSFRGEMGANWSLPTYGSMEESWEEPISVVGQVSMEEFRRLRDSQDRVSLVLFWVHELVTSLVPHLVIPPPLISRVFQEISNGALGYSQAEKLSDIPFPFVFAQLLALCMIFIALVWPICLTLVTGDTWFTPLLSTGVVTGFWTLNELAKELENPYGQDPNNVPLLDAHERFIEFLTEMHGICLPRDRDYKSPVPDLPPPGSCMPSSNSEQLPPRDAVEGDLVEPEMEPEMEEFWAEATSAQSFAGFALAPAQMGSLERRSSREEQLLEDFANYDAEAGLSSRTAATPPEVW